MAYDYSKLRGRIVECYGTLGAFAQAAGISKASVSQKINGKSDFSRYEIEIWSDLLDIPQTQYVDYFFSRKVCNEQTEGVIG